MSTNSIYQYKKDGKPARRKDGSYIWCVEYLDARGNRVTKSTFRSKKEAADWLAGTRVDLRKGTHTPDRDSITIADACDLWLALCQGEVERSTMKQYQEHARLYLKPLFGDRKLSQLTQSDVVEFRDMLRKGGFPVPVFRRGEPTGEERLAKGSDTLARKVLSSLKTVINIAMERGKVAQNVATTLRRTRAKRRRVGAVNGDPFCGRVEIPTPMEMQSMLAVTSEHYPAFYPMLCTAAFTGMRISELRGLDWRCVSLKKGVIRVEQRADEWGTIGDTKTGTSGIRDIEIGHELVRILKEWHIAGGRRTSGLVFPNAAGRPYQVQNLYRRFLHPMQIRAGVTGADGTHKYAFHAFRHFYASGLIHLGYSVSEVQYRLGHSDPAMTLRTYTHLWRDTQRTRNSGQDLEDIILRVTGHQSERDPGAGGKPGDPVDEDFGRDTE
jgi:integrase